MTNSRRVASASNHRVYAVHADWVTGWQCSTLSTDELVMSSIVSAPDLTVHMETDLLLLDQGRTDSHGPAHHHLPLRA